MPTTHHDIDLRPAILKAAVKLVCYGFRINDGTL